MSKDETFEHLMNSTTTIWHEGSEPLMREHVKASHDYGFECGVKHAQTDTGNWHNLTEAIVGCKPIDFEKLDGRKARCVSSDGMEVTYKLERDPAYPLEVFEGWYTSDAEPAWEMSLDDSWRGAHGWTLWLDGEIPMKKQTADELPFGTEFMGKNWLNKIYKYVRVVGDAVQRVDTASAYTASYIEVVEVLGMYGQKESE